MEVKGGADLTLEKFMKKCFPWEGPHVGTGKSVRRPPCSLYITSKYSLLWTTEKAMSIPDF